MKKKFSFLINWLNYVDYLSCNTSRNIWNSVKELNKILQDQKTLKFALNERLSARVEFEKGFLSIKNVKVLKFARYRDELRAKIYLCRKCETKYLEQREESTLPCLII